MNAVRDWRADPLRASGPIGLAGLAREAQTLSHALLSILETPGGQGPVSCGKGCAACCREVIPLSPPEALLLSQTHGRLEWARRAEAEERFGRNTEVLENSGFVQASLIDRAADVYALRLPCPYLEDEACGIHPERPLACREHLALSPAAWCAGFPDTSIRMVDLPAAVGEALADVAGHLMGYRELVPTLRLWQWLKSNRHWADREWEAGPLLDRLASRCANPS